MTSLNLKPETVRIFLGGGSKFNGCKEIHSIFCHDAAPSKVKVEAQIPTISISQANYTICIMLENDGSVIHRASCTCPIGQKCKHISKVLHRIIDSQKNPLPGPSPEVLQRETQRKRRADKMEQACVYIAIACKSEFDTGSDYGRSQYLKDNVDQEILGVFLSKRQANKCAKERANQDEEDTDDEDDDEELFESDEPDSGEYDDDMMFEKIWVERRVIEDASADFHP